MIQYYKTQAIDAALCATMLTTTDPAVCAVSATGTIWLTSETGGVKVISTHKDTRLVASSWSLLRPDGTRQSIPTVWFETYKNNLERLNHEKEENEKKD